MSLVKAEVFVVFLFSNMQNVIAGEKALLLAEVPCLVMPLPSALSASCGLAIKIFPEDMLRTLNLFMASGITPAKLYQGSRENHETHFEEIGLPAQEQGGLAESAWGK